MYIYLERMVSLLIIMIDTNLITNLKLIVASITIYCYYLHMRWTSKVVNLWVVVFPMALTWWKTTSRGLTSWCSPHMKAITVLLYWNHPKMFITWVFCFAEDNKIISGIENTFTELDGKKKLIFNTLPVVWDFRSCYNQL